MKLTIGMAHHDDFHGAYFSIQDIRKQLVFSGKQDLLDRIEFVVVDNNPGSQHAQFLKRFLGNQVPNSRYIEMSDNVGTSVSRNRVVKEASGDFVLVMDCHVTLCPTVETIKRLFQFMEENPHTEDLYSGPLVQDNLNFVNTHFNNSWGSEMWGQWGTTFSCQCGGLFSPRKQGGSNNIEYVSMIEQTSIEKCIKCGKDLPELQFAGHKKQLESLGFYQVGLKNDPPFEIFAQGLGTFFTKRDSWLGFNPHCRGFGGEEGYIHTKYRQAGRKAICLPFLKWLHRFGRPDGVNYPLTLENKVRNYILEFTELGLDLAPVLNEFKRLSEEKINSYVEEANKIYS